MIGCSCAPFNLPEINFVAGDAQKLIFNSYFISDREPFDLEGCSATLSISHYMDLSGRSLLNKEMDISTGADGVANLLVAVLDTNDTKDMFGSYIYQISVTDTTDMSGNKEIKQGRMNIFRKNTI